MPLEHWEFFLYQIAGASFIAGIVLFVLTIIFQGSNIFDDHEIDTGDVHVDTEVLHVGDVHTDINHDGVGMVEGDGIESTAPLVLLFSTFLLSCGGIGLYLYYYEVFNSIIRFILFILFPLSVTFFVSKIWEKITSVAELPSIVKIAVDNSVTALTDVDNRGGLVLAEIGIVGTTTKSMKVGAKTLPGVKISKGQTAYVVDIISNQLVVIDLWPSSPAKKST